MIKHSGGNTIGGSQSHCKIYRRELEYFDLRTSGKFDEKLENQIHSEKTMKITTDHAEHYKKIYRLHNTEVQDFFHRNASGALHVGRLEDSDKWQKLGEFLNIEVPEDYNSHINISKP